MLTYLIPIGFALLAALAVNKLAPRCSRCTSA